MDVLALKAGNDGSIAYVRDGKLEFCHEFGEGFLFL